MTVVRRPGRMLGPWPELIDAEKVSQIRPARETVLKASLFKSYFENHLANLFREAQGRRMRMNGVKCLQGDDEMKRTILENFYLIESIRLREKRTKRQIESYQKVKMIGKGGSGQVWLVRNIRTGDLNALKIVDRRKIILREQLVNMHTEMEVMAQVDSRWIVGLRESFVDKRFLYFVMEYVPGGDLMSPLIKHGKFDEKTTRFFMGEIILAIHDLHLKGFIHRDLKPDNVMLREDGHIKLTDFGLSQKIEETELDKSLSILQDYLYAHVSDGFHHKMSIYGTCDYMSPEALKLGEMAPEDDYWALGVIMYEMLIGYHPFIGQGVNGTMEKVMEWKRWINFSNADVSPEAIDVMSHLICDRSERYSHEQLISHPFFNGFNFNDPGANIPPMVPLLVSPTDTSHFETVEPDSTDELDSDFDEYLPDLMLLYAFSTFAFDQ